MLNNEFVQAELFCNTYSINFALVESWQKMGLVHLIELENKQHIPLDQIQKLEQLLRLHLDLDIQLQDVDIVYNLIEKLKTLQSENLMLKQQLNLYSELL